MHRAVRALKTHPKARGVGWTGEDEELLAAGKKDREASERLIDVELINARLQVIYEGVRE